MRTLLIQLLKFLSPMMGESRRAIRSVLGRALSARRGGRVWVRSGCEDKAEEGERGEEDGQWSATVRVSCVAFERFESWSP